MQASGQRPARHAHGAGARATCPVARRPQSLKLCTALRCAARRECQTSSPKQHAFTQPAAGVHGPRRERLACTRTRAHTAVLIGVARMNESASCVKCVSGGMRSAQKACSENGARQAGSAACPRPAIARMTVACMRGAGGRPHLHACMHACRERTRGAAQELGSPRIPGRACMHVRGALSDGTTWRSGES